ncbi:MAG: hypothetical protein A3K61_06245 [Thaumarchaeota archaeon RBG_16_49_8]|nr:MAG: hypothetical protein A3K61_06245 [Thaumarchaeota archaeon RBG_16_49_8]
MPRTSNIDPQTLFSKVDSREAANLVSSMVQIPSVNPPGNEEGIAQFLAGKMSEIGLEVETFESAPHRPNVIGRLRGTGGGPVLMLNGHLDVVPPGDPGLWTVEPFGGEIRHGKVYGRGSADMRGGLASMLLAAKVLREAGVPLKGDLLLTGVADEEVGGKGANDVVDRGYSADMVVICEPTDLVPLRAHKGILWLEISTAGNALHSSRVSSKGTWGEVNAIYKMTEVIKALQNYLTELEKRTNPLVGNPTVSVGTIIGGTKTNIVPDRCTITVDRRLLPDESPEEAKAEIEQILLKLSEQDPKLKTDLKVIISRSGAVTPEDSPIVQLSKAAAEEALGKPVEVSGCPATSDMEVFVNRAGWPTVIMGPGRIGTAHIVDEYIDVDQVVAAAKIYISLALKTLS